MISAVVKGSFGDHLFRHRLGDGRHLTSGICFCADDGEEPCDWLVVHDDLPAPLTSTVPLNRRILFLSEPPDVKYYHPRYVSQFGIIAGPRKPSAIAGSYLVTQPAIPWFYGIDFSNTRPPLSTDVISSLKPAQKMDAVSVIISKKTHTREHRARLKLVEILTGRLGDKLHIFGRDFTPIGDKREALDGYKYHLALENNVMPHFWTEKLADAWLGWTLPFYVGCPNLDDYFPDGSYVRIDYGDPDGAAAIITEAMASDAYERALPMITAARSLVLNEHSLLSLSARIINACVPHSRGPALVTPEKVFPNNHFRWRRKWSKRIRSYLRGSAGVHSRRLLPDNNIGQLSLLSIGTR